MINGLKRLVTAGCSCGVVLLLVMVIGVGELFVAPYVNVQYLGITVITWFFVSLVIWLMLDEIF